MSDKPSRPIPPVDTQDLNAPRVDSAAAITEPSHPPQLPTVLPATGDSAFNDPSRPEQATVQSPSTAQGTEFNSVHTAAATGLYAPEDHAGPAATQPIEATGDFVLDGQTGTSCSDQVGNKGAFERTFGPLCRGDAARDARPAEPSRSLLRPLHSEAVPRQGRNG